MALSEHIVGKLTDGGRVKDDETAERHIPFTRFLDRGILATKNGDLAIIFELDGIPTGFADDAAIDSASAALSRAFQSSGDGYTMIYTHSIRMQIDTSSLLDPVPTNDFSAHVDQEYRDQLARNTLYQIRHFITLVRRPVEARSGVLGNAIASISGLFSRRTYLEKASVQEEINARTSAIEKLEAASKRITSQLGRFRIRRLGNSDDDKRLTLKFLSFLASGIWQPTPASSQFLSHVLPTGRLTFGGEVFHVNGVSPADNKVGAILAIQSYDEKTFSGMFDDLLSEKTEYIVTQSYLPLDRLDSRNEASDQAKRMEDTNDDGETVRDALKQAVDDISRGTITLGRHHFTITILSQTEADLIDDVANINTAFTASGLKMRREDMGLEAAFWAQLPGNVGYQTRSKNRLISNENFADFCAFNTHPRGERTKLPWGAPITVFPTYSATTYNFSFHAPGTNTNGNTLIFGPPGTGKTAMAGFLLAQSRRLPTPPRIIYFDKDRGAESMIRSLGGDYIRLGADSGSGFNPFAVINDKQGAEWLAGFIERLTNSDLSPEQVRRISEAALRNAEADDAGLKTFRSFLSLLRSTDDSDHHSLMDTLEDWAGDGARAWLFDNNQDTFRLSENALGIDMTSLLATPRTRSAALDYLFYRIERFLEDGKPTIIFLDEGWKLLSDDGFAERIRDWMKTLRKLNAILCFATQEPSDAAKSPISSTLIQSAETMLFFANERADEESYIDAFRLSPIEFATLKELPKERRAMLVKQSAATVLVDANIDDPATIKVMSGTASSVKFMDQLRAEYGPDWLNEYIIREIPE